MPFPDARCRIADVDRPGLEVLHGHAASAQNGPFADGHSWADKRSRGDPDIVLDDDWWPQQRHVLLRVVMASCAQLGIL